MWSSCDFVSANTNRGGTTRDRSTPTVAGPQRLGDDDGNTNDGRRRRSTRTERDTRIMCETPPAFTSAENASGEEQVGDGCEAAVS